MKPPAIDVHAAEIATRSFALPTCLHVPIAARSEEAIERFIGSIEGIISPGSPNRALLVERYRPAPRDPRLKIWQMDGAATLHTSQQVWVHVDYSRYRQAYAQAFPHLSLRGKVLDHVLNREVGRLKGFPYLRIVPISRAANSSSGGLSERWARDYHGTPEMRKKNATNPAQIQHADLADIVKMLDVKTGGALQDPVNEAQAWVRPE